MSKTTEKPRNQAVIDYLRKIPLYPFNPKFDPDFVEELLTDFGTVDVLEETKAFRWYHVDRATSNLRNPRVSLRRWLYRAKKPYKPNTNR
ncbi:MAG: hypothetical protein GY738_18385 [Pseudoalteromonas sp.]|nr:hypothetical protein [Pseudoalteromonas sp.]